MQKGLWRKLKIFLFRNENARQTVLKNTVWLSISNVVARAVKAVLIIYAARILGTAGYGVFSYALSLAAFFSLFSDLGVSAMVTREASKRAEALKEYISTSFVIKAGLVAVSMAAIILLAPLFTNIKEAIPLLSIAAFLIAFDGFRDLSFSITRAREKMEVEAGINIVTNAAIAAIGVVILFVHPTARALLFGYTVGSGLGLLASIVTLRETFRGFFRSFNRHLIVTILREAWPFALMGLLGTVTVNTDAIIIGLMKGASAVGLYSAAQRPVLLLYLVPAILSTSLFPSLARLVTDRERFRNVFERAIAITFLISLPVFVGGALMAKELVGFVFGTEYLPGAFTFALLLSTVLMEFPQTLLGNAIFAYSKQRYFVSLFGIGILMNAALDVLFIPLFGIAGSALGTVITQLAITAILWHMMQRVNPFHIAHRLKKIIWATVVMAVAELAMSFFHIHVLGTLVVSGSIYLGMLFIFKEPLLDLVFRHTPATIS